MNKYFNRRIAVVLFLGFSSGLPLALSGGTLQAWLTVEDVDIKTIGLFSLVGLPYTLKFLWAPFLDRFSVPLFGRRRGWIFVSQFILLILIFAEVLSLYGTYNCAISEHIRTATENFTNHFDAVFYRTHFLWGIIS